MTLSFFSESDEADIPSAPGLYAFYLDMLGPVKIGLSGQGPFSRDTLVAARARLSVRIRKRQELAMHVKLQGELQESKPGGHLRRAYRIEASSVEIDSKAVDVSDIPLYQLREFSRVISQCMTFDKPIYVGITNEQSLRQRYLQHKTDFHAASACEASFGGRYANAGGDWDDLLFGCIALDSEVFESKSVFRLERLIQSLTCPRYSLR